MATRKTTSALTEPVNALYYPHSSIASERLLKSALILWDEIECIVPRGPIRPKKVSRDVAAAMELVVRPHFPSREAQEQVHVRLQQLLAGGVPGWLRESMDSRYPMYADKLLSATWQMLDDYNLITASDYGRDFAVPQALGLVALAMLADECAGVTRTRVTDRERAYSWLFGVMTSEMGGDYLPSLDASHLAESYDRLITASIRIIDTDPIPFKRLIRFRQKYGDALRPLRKLYLEKVSHQVAAMVAPGVSAKDKIEIVRSFEAEMRDDFRDLRKELGYAAKAVLFSKEIGVAVLAVAGSSVVANPLAATAAAVGVGALLGTHAKYKQARERAFAGHAMSWLFNAS